MRTTEQWMAETMQPIIDRLAGEQSRSFTPMFRTVFHTCKAADNLPRGCEGCRERLDGSLDCCQEREE